MGFAKTGGRHGFDGLKGEKLNIVTYNSIINGLCMEGQVDDELGILETVAEKGNKLDVITYNILLNGLWGVGKIDETMDLLNLLLSKEFHINHVVFEFNMAFQGLCGGNLGPN